MLLRRILSALNLAPKDSDAGVKNALSNAFHGMSVDRLSALQRSSETVILQPGQAALSLFGGRPYIAMLVDGALAVRRESGKSFALIDGTFWNERSISTHCSGHAITDMQAGPDGCRVLLWHGRRYQGMEIALYETLWDAVLRSAGRLSGYDIGRKRFVQPSMPSSADKVPKILGRDKTIYILGPGDECTPAGRAQDKNNARWVLNMIRPDIGYIINERTDGFYAERLFEQEVA